MPSCRPHRSQLPFIRGPPSHSLPSADLAIWQSVGSALWEMEPLPITSMAYMFQQTLTTRFLFPSPREPLLLSADWPRGNVLEAAHNASETGRTGECLQDATRPSHHSIAQNTAGTRWWVGHSTGCLVRTRWDDTGRWSNRHPGCLRHGRIRTTILGPHGTQYA